MNKLLPALVASFAFALGLGSSAFSNDIVGTVMDGNGKPLRGAEVVVKAQDSQMTAAAITNQQGQYEIEGLSSGVYFITLDPKGTNLTGQTVVSNLNDNGLTVNWAASPGRQAIAMAQPGIQASSAGSQSPVVADSDKDGDKGDGNSPPGCKGMPGPPCGPKKSEKH
ncbi:MAG: carboxypeptidase-like regulatory domain-containing protein [Candidatus Binataceae bacterium]